MGIGRKTPQTPEEIVQEIHKNMGHFEMERPVQPTLTIPGGEFFQLPPGEEKIIEAWVALQVPFEVELQQKIDEIRTEVMEELGFTDVSQFLPLGFRSHLQQLSGHRFNYPKMFKDDILHDDEATLRRKLYFMNLLVAFDSAVNMIITEQYKGYMERMTEEEKKNLLGNAMLENFRD